MLDGFKGHIIAEPFVDDFINEKEIAYHLGIESIDEVKEMKEQWV